VQRVARESGLAPAQVLVLWNLRHGVAVAPKCSTRLHAAELLATTEGCAHERLTAAHMQALDAITPRGAGRRFIAPHFMTRAGPNAHIYGWGLR
jgi:diketogulonate reductase-like aldo/keto reductase